MGERGVITTRKDIDENGIGVYLHWLGAPEDVYPLLEYCRIRGFRCPEDDSFGYAGLIQVAANASDGDGLSVDVNRLDHLDTNNWNNGTYVIKGWKVVERLYCSDEEPEIDDFFENLRDFDRAQPYDQRIGDVMLKALWERDLTIPEVASSFYTITGCNEF